MLLNQLGSERRAKVAAHETNGELLPLAAYGGGHGNSEGRRSTWPAASPTRPATHVDGGEPYVGSRELRDNGELSTGVGELRPWG